jgi:uncharacterized protein YggE
VFGVVGERRLEMKKRLYVAVIVVTVVALAAGIAYYSGTRAAASATPAGPSSSSSTAAQLAYNSDSMGVWVSGEGKVTTVPDLAVVNLGVEAEAATVEEAMDEAAVAMNRVIDSLHSNGVADADIKTQWFNIYPVREWVDLRSPISSWAGDDDYEVLVGYRVSNMVTVKIRNIDAAGDIIDDVARAGGDLTRLNGVSFTVDDPSAYEDEARELAIADAKAKAQQLARSAGVGLGKPFYISESGGYYPTYWDYGMELKGGDVYASTPISPGETEITLTVQMAFAIQ